MITSIDVIIVLCGVVILSYLFNIISNATKVPSVILLLGTGMILGQIFPVQKFELSQFNFVLEILGTIGLILIVLEGSLDLSLRKEKIPIIIKSFSSAFLILIATTALISFVFVNLVGMHLVNAVVYAVPLGVISSAIAIPSVQKLVREKREFVIYESTFSDILGIMLFNYILMDNPLSFYSVGVFFLNVLIAILISFVSTFLIVFLLNKSNSQVKFFLVFALLILIYAVAKRYHLPSLLLILVFGLALKNSNIYIKGKLKKFLDPEKLNIALKELKLITHESAFLIRTFFFMLFGYTINLNALMNQDVVIVSALIVSIIVLVRAVFLRFLSKVNLFPEMFIAPRGLITIVLFFSIPEKFKEVEFNDGIMFGVILGSSLLMMFSLLLTKTKVKEEI